MKITSKEWRRVPKNRQGKKLQFSHRRCKVSTEFRQKVAKCQQKRLWVLNN